MYAFICIQTWSNFISDSEPPHTTQQIAYIFQGKPALTTNTVARRGPAPKPHNPNGLSVGTLTTKGQNLSYAGRKNPIESSSSTYLFMAVRRHLQISIKGADDKPWIRAESSIIAFASIAGPAKFFTLRARGTAVVYKLLAALGYKIRPAYFV